MKVKPLLILTSFLVWGAGSTYWYVCKIKGFCSQNQTLQTRTWEEKTEKKPVKPKAWIYFKKNDIQPVIEDSLQWTVEVNSWKENKREGKKLLLNAPYFAGEQNTSDYPNLGIARAEQIKKNLASQLDTSWVLTGGQLITADSIPDFVALPHDFVKWVIYNDNVKEINGKTLIYFPHNSTREITNKEILAYMDELAAKLKENPSWKVEITGHTDNTGRHTVNMALGLKRAKRIREMLTKKGIASSQIEVFSKGETEPIADNTSEEGKQKNRRVEILIIK